MAHAILFHQLIAYLAISSLFHLVVALYEADEPIVRLDCSPGVACITRYGAVLPQPFNRTDGSAASTYGDTNVTNVPGFDKLNEYHFLSFDDRFLNLLGTNATYELFFTVANTTHEVSRATIPLISSLLPP